MNHSQNTIIICIALLLAMILIASLTHARTAVKTIYVPEFITVEIHTDTYSPDDIGLVHLTQSDIEEML